MPFASTAFGKRARTVLFRHSHLWGQRKPPTIPGICLACPPPVRPSRHSALKAPGYGADGVDRFLTWNLLFGLKDGTDYTPFLPAHVVLMGKTSAAAHHCALGANRRRKLMLCLIAPTDATISLQCQFAQRAGCPAYSQGPVLQGFLSRPLGELCEKSL
jgi:hypothetical protein